MQVSLEHKRLCRIGPPRRQALSAVSTLRCLPGGLLLVGGAEGRLIAVDTAQPERQVAGKMPLTVAAEARLPDGISSIAVHPSTGEVVVGTRKSDMFRISLTEQVRLPSKQESCHWLILAHKKGCPIDSLSESSLSPCWAFIKMSCCTQRFTLSGCREARLPTS